MLADLPRDIRSGRFDATIQPAATSRRVILNFVGSRLAAWRDDPTRPREQAETLLTEHLCDYLNAAVYQSTDLSHIQFRTETGDETRANRKIDLSIKPRVEFIIEGRLHNIFDTILPIECKRLPTPAGTDRDEREYVFNRHASTGGIQRFKAGEHAASHEFAGMIGYVQENTCAYWSERIAEWIAGLMMSNPTAWTEKDHLRIERSDTVRRVAVLSSSHSRVGSTAEIELRHLWVEMD